MKEVRDKARELMKGYCRVCRVCDGRACAGEVPGMGGLGTGAAFKSNVDSLAAYKFNMRTFHDITDPKLTTTLMGQEFSLPVIAAPIGGVSFNMGGQVTEEDYITAKMLGCAEFGSCACTGDGVPDFIHEAGFNAIEAAKGRGIPFIKPWDDEELFAKLDKAAATGAFALGMDIDACGLVTLAKMGRPVSPKPPEKLAEIIKKYGMKFIIKGIMTPEEAKMAVEAGADAIVVSNHGGRVLDHTPGGAQVLPLVARKVKGQITILADGGVRTGVDVLKMLALGADAVMIGRPFSIASVGGGRAGVVKYLETLRTELTSAMVMTGTDNVRYVKKDIIFQG